MRRLIFRKHESWEFPRAGYEHGYLFIDFGPYELAFYLGGS